jgi:Ca2+-transporting ATPase
MLVIIYVPFLQKPFHTFPLGIPDWVIIILLAATVFPVLEISKAIMRWVGKKGLLLAAF